MMVNNILTKEKYVDYSCTMLFLAEGNNFHVALWSLECFTSRTTGVFWSFTYTSNPLSLFTFFLSSPYSWVYFCASLPIVSLSLLGLHCPSTVCSCAASLLIILPTFSATPPWPSLSSQRRRLLAGTASIQMTHTCFLYCTCGWTLTSTRSVILNCAWFPRANHYSPFSFLPPYSSLAVSAKYVFLVPWLSWKFENSSYCIFVYMLFLRLISPSRIDSIRTSSTAIMTGSSHCISG